MIILLLGLVVFGDIPKIIIQTGPNSALGDFDGLPERMQQKNADFEHQFFNDDSMLEFVEEHFPNSELLELMVDSRLPVVAKTDLFRLAAVLTLGGFYMDMDVYAYKNMGSLNKEKAVFPKEWKKDDKNFEARHGKLPEDELERWQMGNYAFGAEAGHPLLADALEEGVKRAKLLVSERESKSELEDQDVLKTTGPYMLSEVYHEGRKSGKYDDVNFLDGSNEIAVFKKSHGPNTWHKFGDFAEHVITHTWVRRRLATEEELAEILWQNSVKRGQDMHWAKNVISELKHRFGEMTISAVDEQYAETYGYSFGKKPVKKKVTAKKPTNGGEAALKEAQRLARVEGIEKKKVSDTDLEWAVGVLKRHFVRHTRHNTFEIAVGGAEYDGYGGAKLKGKKEKLKEEGLGKLDTENSDKSASVPDDIPVSTRVFIFAGILLSVSVLVYVWNSKSNLEEERAHLLGDYDHETVEARSV